MVEATSTTAIPMAGGDDGEGHSIEFFVVAGSFLIVLAIGIERGWWASCLQRLLGRQDDRLLNSNRLRRGTIDADIELANVGKLNKMFGEDGRLVSSFQPRPSEYEQEPENQTKKSEIEEQNQRLKQMTVTAEDKAAAREAERKAAEVRGAQIRAQNEAEAGLAESAAAADMSFAVSGEEETAAEEVPSTGTTKKKRGVNHAFIPKDGAKARAAAKASLSSKEEEVAPGVTNANDEGDIAVAVTRVDGSVLGMKYGPGLVVTEVQAGSLVAQWNASNPLRAVQKGCKVTSVNSVTANAEMLKLLRSKEPGLVEITLKTP